MGMAASQARLLSITSRMSDNELRAQLINNAKMRLTTDSSRVSDEYIAALNQTQMMFTNFDTMGNEQYQSLTFNSLTAYSSYNNQYGIVNAGGELMVSKADAEKFEKAGGVNGNLETFLNSYGLVKDTTYFDKYKLDSVGYYDNYGKWQDLGITVGDMRDIYEGNIDSKGIEHYGYEASLNSPEYGLYNNLVIDYHTAKSAYQTAVHDEMTKFMEGSLTVNKKKLTAGGKNFETLYNEVSVLTADNLGTIHQYADYMKDLMGQLGYDLTSNSRINGCILKDNSTLDGDKDVFAHTIKYNYDVAKLEENNQTTDYQMYDKTYAFVLIDKDGNEHRVTSNSDFTTLAQGQSGYVSKTKDTVGGSEFEVNGEPWYFYTSQGFDTDRQPACKIQIPDGWTMEFLFLDADGNLKREKDLPEDYTPRNMSEITKNITTTDPETGNVTTTKESMKMVVEEIITLTKEDILDSLKNMYDYFKNNAFTNLDEKYFRTEADTTDKYHAYITAAQKLANFIYGENGKNINEKYYDYLDDPSWVLSTNHIDYTIDAEYTRLEKDENGNTIEVTYTLPTSNIDRTHFNDNMFPTTTPGTEIALDPNRPSEKSFVSYQAVKDVFLIECMLNQFGEPNYTWIDKANPNENADAKATWYTNLFERMKEGYKELPENLMDSQEWLQFAFESGLVHMEQVDKSGAWVSTMYSNCSNITESTVDVDVTIAEAKYKREMNKIQAKDKQYDMELKNIDTEHNSLQTEYDSIKSVIDKNVERNFKMFQA